MYNNNLLDVFFLFRGIYRVLNRQLHNNSNRIIAALHQLQMKYSGVTLILREKYRVSQVSSGNKKINVLIFFLPRISRKGKDSVLSISEKLKNKVCHKLII